MEKRWVLSNEVDPAKAAELAKSLNIRKSLAKLLLQRNITSFEEAKTFFRPSLSRLHDPFLMKDMDRAVNRLSEAIFHGQQIMIYGDYDVDGTTSVSLMYRFLSNFTKHLTYYIPDRYDEGYGISSKGIQTASDRGINLIIALDCGIRAIDQAREAKEYNIDLIICDHHLPGETLPGAYAILDPKRPDDFYPFKELSGCGVGFKLLQGFCIQNTIPKESLFEHLDLVAVSVASDIVPIIGENRILAFYGLKKLNFSPNPGLKALIQTSGLKNEIDISGIVFYIGPRINATGRLRHAHESVKLLISKSEDEAQTFAEGLNSANTDRRGFDQTITAEALEMVEADESLVSAKSTVLYKNDWHKGVIGIVASRCIEKYYRPTIILTSSNDKVTGSARSVEGFDIHEAISACGDLLEQFGGHTHAAGLTLAPEKVPDFQRRFEEVVANTIPDELTLPKLEIDLEVDFSFISYKTFGILKQMAPFGPHNPKPVFLTRRVTLKSQPKIIKDIHVKLYVSQEGHNSSFDAIGFGLAEKAKEMTPNMPFDIVYQIEENVYQGHKTLQLNVKDIKLD